MKMRLETPDVVTSMKMLDQGQSAVTAAKAGGYKTVSGMRSAIRAYERKNQLAQNPETEAQKSEAAGPVEPYPSEMDKNRSGGGSVIFHNPFSPKQEKPVHGAARAFEDKGKKNEHIEAAARKMAQTVEGELKKIIKRGEDAESQQTGIEKAEEPPKGSVAEQEILEAGAPLRTLETSNFRVSYHKQLGSLRISVRRKAGRYMQFNASDARELYAALGFMVNRYNLDKDDDFDKEERDA